MARDKSSGSSSRRKTHFEIVRKSEIAALFEAESSRLPRILSVTYDPSLAKTRELLLSGAGFQVLTFLNTAAAIEASQRQPFQLAIIGHSIPVQERIELVSQLRRAGDTRVLALIRPGEPHLANADYFLDPAESPALLLETVMHILGPPKRAK